MLQSVNSISTTVESSSLRLPPGEVTTRVVTGSRVECQLSQRNCSGFGRVSALR